MRPTRGFVAGRAGACGIKESGAADLAVVATEDRAPAIAAGVFTTNLAQAAPVQISMQHLADGRAAAVVLNSGNANAATGDAGRADARRMCALTGEGLGVATTDVLVCSTGLIGIPMPMAPVESGIPKLCGAVSAAGGLDAAQAIMTTDTVAKQSVATAGAVTVGGMAKGAAMLSPAMATMLAVVTTDAAIDRVEPAARARACGFRVVRLPDRRRCALDERHRARPRQRPGGRRRPNMPSPTRSPRCAASSPSRWRATPKAPPSSSRCT